jgi:hypothetical protein
MSRSCLVSCLLTLQRSAAEIDAGLNINRTERILIRLRYHHDSRQFLSMEQVTDTLLHELSHIVFGPHNADFNNLWNELRDEHQSLLMKGYSGEGFLSQGQKLGGKRIPVDEMRRAARTAAEKRKATDNLNAGGHRLGGAPVVSGVDMRKVISDAATRRTSITDGCASGSAQAGNLVHQQEQEGFRTAAEQNDGNDEAIAQALQELLYEEEMQRLEELGAPTGGGGLAWDRQNGLQFDSDPPSRTASPASGRSSGLSWSKEHGLSSISPSGESQRPAPPRTLSSPAQRRPLSRLVTENHRASSSTSINRPEPRLISQDEQDRRNKELPPTPPPASPLIPINDYEWACPQCTLHNPLEFLQCGVCGLEQPPQPIPQHKRFGPSHTAPSLPAPPPQSGLRGPDATPFEPAKGRIGWNCLQCGTFMENQWWTCSLCGTMKADS